MPSYFGFVCRKEAVSQNDLDIVLARFSLDQKSSNSKQSMFLPAIFKALIPPALVPIKKSKISKIFLPEAISSCLRKITAAIARTPPPSNDKTNFFFLGG